MKPYFFEHTEWNAGYVTGWCFYQFPFELCRTSTEKHIAQLPELVNAGFQDSKDYWQVSFEYQDYKFTVDCHSHGATASFIAERVDCPDEVLLQVIGLFVVPIEITADALANIETDSGSERCSKVDDRSSRMFRWGIRGMSLVCAVCGIYGLANGDFPTFVGCLLGTVITLIASFSLDFR